MPWTVILNPTAHAGAAGRKIPLLRAAFDACGIPTRFHVTVGPGHASDIARDRAREGLPIVAAGGDGTVQEVVRGLADAGRSVPLGLVPVGTGNDFARSLGLPLHPVKAIRALAAAQPVAVDCGKVRWKEDQHAAAQLFVNAVGFGFDASVAREVETFKRLPGKLAYVAALLRVLWRWHGPPVRVDVTSQARTATVYEGPLFFASVGNGKTSGGGLYLTPAASVVDGVLDVCVVAHLPARRVLRLAPSVLFGQHGRYREVGLHQGTAVSMQCPAGMPLHADGEVLARAVTEVRVEVLPGYLSILVPPATKMKGAPLGRSVFSS